MNFIAFSVDTTNICPMANSHAGGQLVTEYSLRAMSSLNTPESVKYMIGPSYAHSAEDFMVQLAGSTDFFNQSVATSGSIIEVSEGRAVVNGYFIESLAPITIDLAELSYQAQQQGQSPLTGDLCIGLRTMFSTDATLSGSLKVENSDSMYEGIQIIILPVDQVVTPVDSPADQTAVNMYLKLATFTFVNGNITNIVNNYPGKCQYIPANRIDNIDFIISNDYVKKVGLNPKRLYVYSGKSNDPDVGGDTWCDATDSLFVWGNSIPQYVSEEPAIKQAQFYADIERDAVDLIIPHKQVDGMKTALGEPQYFDVERLPLPKASFELNTPGFVSSVYTSKMKDILNKVNEYYNLPNGRQRKYIEELHDVSELPEINAVWRSGDYVLIARDFTVDYASSDSVSAPSTLRVVCPGMVVTIMYKTQKPDGVELDRTETDTEPLWFTTDWHEYQNKYFRINDYYGDVNEDYFTVIWVHRNDDDEEVRTPYYYVVQSANPKEYSDPIVLYGGTPLASTSTVGGFIDIPTSEIDQGYVYLDSNGHLRLLDYGLLRSGFLAYQLGEDFTVPAGLSIDGIQQYLDEYVNQRVAFPNANQMQRSNPNVINIYIDFSSVEDEIGTINLYGVDSRFDTSIYVHIVGSPTSSITLNIADCQKVRIDPSISGNPTINLYRSGLYYDADVLNRLSVIRDFSLWYERYSSDDAALAVNGLTVSQMASSNETMQSYASSEYWSASNPNDNHFTVALQSITFDTNGYVCGCGVYVRNESTSNVSEGTFVIHDEFDLPIGPGLIYPRYRMTKPIKVTGHFISAYQSSTPSGYMVQETSFSLCTPAYAGNTSAGNIAFLVKSYYVIDADPAVIDVWDTGSFNYFEGMTAL